MALTIDRHTDPSKTEITIVVRGETYGDCSGSPARQFAQNFAQSIGFPVRGLANSPSPYPVNKKGEASEKVAVGLEPIDGYESEFRFVRQ